MPSGVYETTPPPRKLGLDGYMYRHRFWQRASWTVTIASGWFIKRRKLNGSNCLTGEYYWKWTMAHINSDITLIKSKWKCYLISHESSEIWLEKVCHGIFIKLVFHNFKTVLVWTYVEVSLVKLEINLGQSCFRHISTNERGRLALELFRIV